MSDELKILVTPEVDTSKQSQFAAQLQTMVAGIQGANVPQIAVTVNVSRTKSNLTTQLNSIVSSIVIKGVPLHLEAQSSELRAIGQQQKNLTSTLQSQESERHQQTMNNLNAEKAATQASKQRASYAANQAAKLFQERRSPEGQVSLGIKGIDKGLSDIFGSGTAKTKEVEASLARLRKVLHDVKIDAANVSTLDGFKQLGLTEEQYNKVAGAVENYAKQLKKADQSQSDMLKRQKQSSEKVFTEAENPDGQKSLAFKKTKTNVADIFGVDFDSTKEVQSAVNDLKQIFHEAQIDLSKISTIDGLQELGVTVEQYERIGQAVERYAKQLRIAQQIEKQSAQDGTKQAQSIFSEQTSSTGSRYLGMKDAQNGGIGDLNFGEKMKDANGLRSAAENLQRVLQELRIDAGKVTTLDGLKQLGLTEAQYDQIAGAVKNYATELKQATQAEKVSLTNKKEIESYAKKQVAVEKFGYNNSKIRKDANLSARYDKVSSGWGKAVDKGDVDTLRQFSKELDQISLDATKKGLLGRGWMDKLRDQFDKFGIYLTASGAISTGIQQVKKMITDVLELDKAVTNLQVATGYNRRQTQDLLGTYSEMGKELGASTLEVADSADTWLRQGKSVEDTNVLIKNTMMLSKLGMMDSADAATAMTSAMKGYNVSVEESQGIVDKFTAVDMNASVSAGYLATAMAETATSARLAGVDIDKLTGYIASVGEVTQDGPESVGNFFKTLMARMGNVKAGKLIDPETQEDINICVIAA